MTAAMSRNLEVVHVGFLVQVTGQNSKRQMDDTWEIAAEVRVLKEEGTQILGAYIDKQQVTVAEWVVLSPILDIFDR